jgi:uncharacterized repeat protein (TIGR01451 family)
MRKRPCPYDGFSAIIAPDVKTITRWLACLLSLLAIGASVSGDEPRGVPTRELPPPAPEERESEPQLRPAVLAPDLARELSRRGPNEDLRVIVYLQEQANLELVSSGAVGRRDMSHRTLQALQTTAARTQEPLLRLLESARAGGLVRSFTSFWVFNGFAVEARPSLIRALAEQPAVGAIRLDHYRSWLEVEEQEMGPPLVDGASDVEWNVAQIQAPQVWASLNISGTGTTVAGMDTGVDWLHPALQAGYRGYNPHGSHVHAGNWHDAVNGTLYPVDDHSHGTHTLGTAVGRSGIGVAPGAQWIGVKVLNSSGHGWDSWIHAGFQWLLAPGGDPARAPDVVNCSWGSSNGYLTTFQADVAALRAAGIIPVFSNGNDGPLPQTVGSPASLSVAFAVGATDSDDDVASFSSRGPSPWGEIRPHVVAPGVNVRSSMPGGVYGTKQGTSMAAPHVAGLSALLRSAEPELTVSATLHVITTTALPLGTPVPNNDYGWGRIDSLAAVAAVVHPGYISGTVTTDGTEEPIAGATVVAVPHPGGGGGSTASDEDGRYWTPLAPGTYDLTASAFGHQPDGIAGLVVTTDTVSVADFALTALPTGTLQVEVTGAESGQPLVAAITLDGTPLAATGSSHTFEPPEGTYTVRASRMGYRVVTTTASVTATMATTASLALPSAPSILLVDSGPWDYTSEIGYYRQALDDLAYAYDEWTIKSLSSDIPQEGDLIPYDIVVWSAPTDAPGFIGAESAITGYLSSAGRLLLSGQDIGFLDDGGTGFFYAPYYRGFLKAQLVDDSSEDRILEGVSGGIFAGQTVTITGSGGADNQFSPDVVAPFDPDGAGEALVYQEGGCGGLRIGTCLPYKALYLSFGFEGIDSRLDRRQIMDAALAWLASEPPEVGFELSPAEQTRVGVEGSTVTHTLRLRHVGEGGTDDTFDLQLSGNSWATELGTAALTLSPCTSSTVVVSVTVPMGVPKDGRDQITVTARSTLSPTLVQTATLVTKAPASILLVDDDRWYEQRSKYEAALAESGLRYDVWETHAATGSVWDVGPYPEVLARYPIVVWWTGYDWYRPVSPEQLAWLETYLEEGGRLFLSSQEFLYHHGDTGFGRRYLGLLSATEDVTPTRATGVADDPVGDRLGPYELDYPFKNYSDEVLPWPETAISFRDQSRRGIALSRDEGSHRTVFLSFPFETLPEEERPEAMRQAVGWLSWLGGSTFEADRGAVGSGDTVTYTLRLANDGPLAVNASLYNTLPLSATLVPASLSGPATYFTATDCMSWTGQLAAGEGITVTYSAALSGSVGAEIVNTARLRLEDHWIGFDRSAVVRIGVPDLSPSALWCEPAHPRPGSIVTCTLAAVNAGPADALSATLSISLPTRADYVPGSLAWVGGGNASALEYRVGWAGSITAGGHVTVTYALQLPVDPLQLPHYSVAFLEDGTGLPLERAAWVVAEPYVVRLIAVFRNYSGE